MGRRKFLIALLLAVAALSSSVLHARADGHGPVRVTARALLRNPEPEPSIAEPPVSADGEAEAPTGPEIAESGTRRSSGNSAAGGGVIIGGLVTAIFGAVYCYIRVTRRRRRPAENLG